MATAAILDFVESEIWRQGPSRLSCIYLHTKFGEDILKGGRVMTIYVFLKWQPAAILDFQISEIWRYFCFRNVGFSLWAKFCVNMCNCNSAWVMAIKVNFHNGGSRHLDFCPSEIWRRGKSRLARIYLGTKFGEDIMKGGRVMTIYVFLKWRPAAILDFQIFEIRRYFCFQEVGFSPWAKFCVNICNSDWVRVVN